MTLSYEAIMLSHKLGHLILSTFFLKVSIIFKWPKILAIKQTILYSYKLKIKQRKAIIYPYLRGASLSFGHSEWDNIPSLKKLIKIIKYF